MRTPTRPRPPIAAAAACLALALAAAAPLRAAPASPPVRPPAARPAVSAIVVLAAPSVADRLAADGWAAWGGRAADVAAAAAEPAARARLAEWHAATLASQSAVLARAKALGLTVVARYAVVGNGVQVHGAPAAVARLAAAPGVARLEAAPRFRPAVVDVAAHPAARRGAAAPPPARRAAVAAAAAARALDATGAGQTIAIVDTGIDYTHAAFGGPGTPAAYAAARAAAERVDDLFEGQVLFPNGRVVGGWDFVGPNYTSPGLCPPAEVAAGRCTGTPHPDPDPLDGYGHGTAVAGLAAGLAVGDLPAGAAPGASLVALKVFGPPARAGDTDEAADVVIDALEWCAGANLGLERRGAVPARIDVVNLSLGEPWAQGSRFFDAAVAAVVNAGSVVVAAAGNQGDRPFVVTAPGSSPHALAVAATTGDAARDAVASFSSRGPSRHGALKPDLAAPGVGLRTAAMGAGAGATVSSGTSMASPQVAGAAARVLEHIAHGAAAAALVPGGASDVAARLANAGRPEVGDGRGARAPVARQGAGRLGVGAALSATLVVRAGDGSGIHLGRWPRLLSEPRHALLDVFNPTAAPITFTLSARPRAGDALRVELPPGHHVAPPGARTTLDVAFAPAPSADLPALDLGFGGTVAAAAYDAAAADGWIEIRTAGAAGADTDALAAIVPYGTVFRAASAVRVAAAPSTSADGPSLRLSQPDVPGASPGAVELFHLLTPTEGDPDEPAVRYEADLWHVGARWSGIAPGDGAAEGHGPRLTFGLARHALAVVPYGVVHRVVLDVDGDGRVDRVAVAGVESAVLGAGGDDQMVAAVFAWNPALGAPAARPLSTAPLPFTLDSRVVVFEVPLADLGLAAPRAVAVAVESIGRLEDWLPLDDGDGRSGAAVAAAEVVPDGASLQDAGAGAPWLVVPAPGARRAPRPWRAVVGPGEAVDLRIVGGCAAAAGPWLALIPANLAFSETGADDVAVVAPAAGTRDAAGCRVWLPVGWAGAGRGR